MNAHKNDHGMGVMESWWEVRIMSGLPRMIAERLFFGNPIKRILELLALEGNETVVDSGCGSGYYTLPLAKLLPTGLVEAVDLSNAMLKVLGKRLKRSRLIDRVNITEGDCEALPLADGTAHAGIIIAALHHLDHPRRAIEELYRVLQPGGRVVAVDWNPDTHHLKDSHSHGDEHGFREVSIAELLEVAGFADIHTEVRRTWIIGFARKPYLAAQFIE